MFQPIEGGSSEVVHGLRCWIPPQPEHHEIMNWDLPRDEQMWRKIGRPSWYDDLRAEEEYEEEQLEIRKAEFLKKKRGPLTKADREFLRSEHFNPKLEEYRQQEWHRRLNGFWLYIDGKATYITGKHYFYLEHCILNIGPPKYFDISRQNFYFREYCFQCPYCLGYLVIGSRGVGKTEEEVCVALEELTRGPGDRHGAIQSKSEDDAVDVVFKKKMVPMYQKLPHFFKPIDSHGSDPSNFLRWTRDTVKGKGAKKVTFETGVELRNSIMAYPAKDKKLDGGTFAIIIEDEVGKTDPKKEADVYKRAEVNRFCVWRFGRKVGMILSMSTVEEMGKGGAECKKLWDDSDQSSVPEGEMTVSGRFRRFYGVLEADPQFFDKFGKIDREASKAFHDNERKKRMKDPAALASYIRKNPYYASEAFREDASQCQFNVEVIDNRLQELAGDDDILVRGDFDWSDGPDSQVVFHKDKNKGRCKLWWLPGNPEETNMVEWTGEYNELGAKIWKPLNDAKFIIGADPIQYGFTEDKRHSRPVSYVHRRYDPTVDCGELTLEKLMYNASEIWEGTKLIKEKFKYQTGLEIVQYDYRPQEPTIYYEYMIKLCRFFGCMIHAESQKAGGLIAHFKARGYYNFIMKKVVVEPDFKKEMTADQFDGTAATSKLIQQYTGLIAKSVNYFGHRCMFSDLLEDNRKFRPDKTTEYDYTVAKGFVELGLLKQVVPLNQKPMDITDYLSIFVDNQLLEVEAEEQ